MQAANSHLKHQTSNPRACFKKSPQKLDLGSCSRHLQCLEANGSPPKSQNDSISINEDLLKLIEPQIIATDPVFEFQSKPEVDLLANVNIRKKQLETLIHNHEQQQQAERKKQLMARVKDQAQELISKCKKVPQGHPTKWGHSAYVVGKVKENQEDKSEVEPERVPRDKPPLELKPINQRISQYKRKQQLLKIKSAENFKKTHRQDINIQQCNQKIQENAEKVLHQIKSQREKAQQDKNVLRAKIRALQIQALNKVAQAKKKPLEPSLQFNLGDSVYSTFEARAEGRKKIKQSKQKRQVIADASLLQTKKSNYLKAGSKQPRSTPRKDKIADKNNVTKRQRSSEGVRQSAKQGVNAEAQLKGTFFIWNIPIMPEDVNKLQAKSQDIFMNVDRFNYKSGKTFREEANEYLTQKMQRKMEIEKQELKQQRFLAQVHRKKQILDRQFESSQAPRIQEVIWNEDEVFRPNVLQNFHFYGKENFADLL